VGQGEGVKGEGVKCGEGREVLRGFWASERTGGVL
jgi:hypothetical protein